ncbi:MAG: hypothetical protein ACE5JJ_04305 [Nitrospinota bacterium]
MEFRLAYRGQLKPNGDVKHKQKLRRAFHPQLRELWEQPPLKVVADKHPEFLRAAPSNISLVENVGGFQFVPLVNEHLKLIAQLDITLLRPGPPGVTKGGDIDNRLKTLLDALRMPKENELPSNDAPKDKETPFFCLLEDDALVTGLSVTTDRLLEPVNPANPSEVILLICVRVRGTSISYDNMPIIG